MLAHFFQTLKAYIMLLRLVNSTFLNLLMFSFIFSYFFVFLTICL